MNKQLSVELVLIFSLLLLAVEANAQQTVVTGTVTDAQTGNTLPGANILVIRNISECSDGQQRAI